MPDLLLELGCEELPASFVRKAYTDLAENLRTGLASANLGHGEIEAHGTPRRLIVWAPGLPEGQAPQSSRVRGPGLAAAFDANGNATAAVLGFCRGHGGSPEQLERSDGYVWLNKTTEGKPTGEALSEILPAAIRALNFEKSMRWGSGRMRFARPIRWILAAFGGSVVEFDVESVRSGLESHGHRFYSPEAFQATTLEGLHNELVHRYVELHPAAREAEIVRQVKKVAEGEPSLRVDLIEENTFLTEWPTALQGRFKAEYLELPTSVLVTAMAKHEKMFPVLDAEGKITDQFVFVRNGGDDATVRSGAEWVLNARFNDAKFFFDEDKKRSLDEFLNLTERIVFHEKLGTVRTRADRLAGLAGSICDATGGDSKERAWAEKAGLYCKADLSSGLVSELTSLQGIIGGEYARREGFDDPVCWAIASHYDLSKNPTIDCDGARTAVRVLMADQLDRLAGYLGIGLAPSGSSDPFGLRRAATMLIEAAWRWPTRMQTYVSAFKLASEGYKEGSVDEKSVAAFAETLSSRYSNLLPDVRHDILAAAVLADDAERSCDPQGVRFRIDCMSLTSDDNEFVQTATRPLNIVAAAIKKGQELKAGDLQSAEGDALASASARVESRLQKASAALNSTDYVEALRELRDPINAFFESTMVMAVDAAVRAARLGLLDAVRQQLLFAGDFSKLDQA